MLTSKDVDSAQQYILGATAKAAKAEQASTGAGLPKRGILSRKVVQT
jgi:hypothetical protein